MNSKKVQVKFRVDIVSSISGRTYFLYDEKEVLSVKLQKSMFNPIGSFSVELRNSKEFDWEELIATGDFVSITINDQLKMQGLVTAIGYSSGLKKQGISTRTVIKGNDLGLLFTKFAKILSDFTYRMNNTQVGLIFFEAFANIREQYDFTKYDLRKAFDLSWNEIIKAYTDTAFALGATPTVVYGILTAIEQSIFNFISDSFDLNYPMTLHILQENYDNVWEFWKRISNPPFTELFCDTVAFQQKVGIFGSRAFETNTTPGFYVMCRPNTWLGDNFNILKDIANEVDAENFVQITATRSAAEVKSGYLVYAEGGISATELRANGDFAVDASMLARWGLDIQETPISSLNYAKDGLSYVRGLADILKDAYGKIEQYYAGSALLKYHDVRVGQCVKIPYKIGSEKIMYALVTDVVDELISPASMNTQITFVRGELETPSLLSGITGGVL